MQLFRVITGTMSFGKLIGCGFSKSETVTEIEAEDSPVCAARMVAVPFANGAMRPFLLIVTIPWGFAEKVTVRVMSVFFSDITTNC